MNDTSFSSVDDFLNEPSFRAAVFEKNPKDVQHWDNWLHDHPHLREQAQEARKILLSVRGEVDEVSQGEIDLAISRVMAVVRPDESNHHFQFKFWLKIAASVVITASVAWGFYNAVPQRKQAAALMKSATTPFIFIDNKTDQAKLVRFPDGSSAMLATNSTIKFPNSFNKSQREVYLSGEAFFEVAKNAKWPFVVFANELVTEVLGTSFLVNAYPEAKNFEVRVKTGKVKLFHKNQSDASIAQAPSITLVENEKAFLNRDAGLFTNGTTDNQITPNVPAAFSRTFDFKRKQVTEVFAILERSYNLVFLYDKEAVVNCTLTASLGDEPLQEKLNMITASLDASYAISGDTVRLTSLKPCY